MSCAGDIFGLQSPGWFRFISLAAPVRSSSMFFSRRFRVIHKLCSPEYSRARRKTVLCDHCRVYVKKIQPRAHPFLLPATDGMQNACPAQLLRRARYKTLFSNHYLAESLKLLREVLNTVHDCTYPALRRAAPRPEQIQHTEGSILKSFLPMTFTCLLPKWSSQTWWN